MPTRNIATSLVLWSFISTSVSLVCFSTNQSFGQAPLVSLPSNVRPLLKDSMPPGEIGAIQLARKPQLRGVWQAVEIQGPEGLKISMADAGQFTEPLAEPRVAVMVGYAYRLQITGIEGYEDVALYPTLEVIDRIHPPAEREHRFPIPVEIDATDLADAAEGNMVMRVIYLEDNQIAEPVNTAGFPQRVLELGPHQDALHTADRMGRPVAILRIGSRVPNVSTGQDWDNFLFGCPPWATIKPVATKELVVERGNITREARSGSISDQR